jgi:hypothetical protein
MVAECAAQRRIAIGALARMMNGCKVRAFVTWTSAAEQTRRRQNLKSKFLVRYVAHCYSRAMNSESNATV